MQTSSQEVLYDGPINDEYDGFITASGKKLVDQSGKEYFIKGIAFGNAVFSNSNYAPVFHHSEESYKEIAELGFNSVRFYLNYGLFEYDGAPYTYREQGFEWLDKNIAWAKKYGIRLVLNMHYPQGGYQSKGGGTALWTEPENKKRLTALWTEIAKRYADEPVILGYGLINEPFVAVERQADAISLYETSIQNMVDSMRAVNDTQIIFVEKIHTVQVLPSMNKCWPTLNDRLNFPVVNDDNIVYEFHYYYPLDFTHQKRDSEPVCYPYTKNGTTYDKAFMENSLRNLIAFSENNNVPIYCGEFGTVAWSFPLDNSGERWVTDILDILLENKIHFNYHAYHDGSFGLYTDGGFSLPYELNEPLYNVFSEKLK